MLKPNGHLQEFFADAVKELDSHFGDGYSKAHPIVLGAAIKFLAKEYVIDSIRSLLYSGELDDERKAVMTFTEIDLEKPAGQQWGKTHSWLGSALDSLVAITDDAFGAGYCKDNPDIVIAALKADNMVSAVSDMPLDSITKAIDALSNIEQ